MANLGSPIDALVAAAQVTLAAVELEPLPKWGQAILRVGFAGVQSLGALALAVDHLAVAVVAPVAPTEETP